MKKKTGKGSKEEEFNARGAGEYRTGPVAGTALVTGKTFDLKGLQYAEVDGMAVFEGDIILGTVAELQASADAGTGGGELPQFSCGITGANVRWPNATVPYDIDASLPNQQRVTDAIAHWEANTRIRFVLRTAANAAQYQDYVHIIPSNGCWSFVGRRGGKQDLGLAGGCSMGNTIHELGHAIGLWHEQSREDRNTFVRIEWANIDPSAQHNFNQHIADGDDLGPYDYGSIMHYSTHAFSINGQPTIVPLQPIPAGVVIGQRNGLSQGDIDGINAMYPPPRTFKEVRKDPVRDPTIKEVRKDPVRDPTIKEVRKDPIKDGRYDTIKEVRKDPIRDPTIKEVRKDPAYDPTIKEVGRDPIEPIDPGRPIIRKDAYAYPFITGAPSRAIQESQGEMEQLAAYVEELAEAIAANEQQLAELMSAYDEAVQALESMGGGQV